MALTTEQRIEMSIEARELRRTGQPEKATKITDSMKTGEYFMGESVPGAVELPDQPPTHGPGSSAQAWRDFAFAYSDFDTEIIETTKKQDLIKMLQANGLAE